MKEVTTEMKTEELPEDASRLLEASIRHASKRLEPWEALEYFEEIVEPMVRCMFRGNVALYNTLVHSFEKAVRI
jgi:hypothetical protein